MTTLTETTFTDEIKYWDAKALDTQHTMLATIQSSAGKWQASIAAFLGLYGTVGFVIGPSQLANLPVHGYVLLGALIAYGLAGVFGLTALALSNLAAQGIPKIFNQPIVGEWLSEKSTARARTASTQLRWGIGFALVAGLFAVGISVFLIVTGALAARHSSALVTGPSGAYCGQLQDSDGTLSLLLPGGKVVPLAGASVTQVSSCP
ncbi:MAG TPA: hypothetical protein VGZ32_22315 [Actinocrinis sp.]|jgi:hypothetical protein|uniref:hypothetical protein n=1 Tax=Actinocrinis sp. TaxID=1920516 RepID=UPI002DDD8672|nr:hypothetical protein [Actinocrinis sp.]HEV3173098.1 hypothetical protein [Actinocrinis sp.]